MEKIYYIPTDKKVLCLTFDDGPNTPTTSIILDILKRYKIKATFFVLAENILHNQNTFKEVVQEEHDIGLHGFNHISFSKHPEDVTHKEIQKCFEILNKFNINPIYFRPPYGTLTPYTEIATKHFNMTSVGWTIMKRDYFCSNPLEKAQGIMNTCKPGKIITMHDGCHNRSHTGSTIKILEIILPYLITEGYSFVSIPTLIATKINKQYKIFNNVPLLGHEITIWGHKPYLLLYWDVNFIKDNKSFQLRIMDNNKIIDMNADFPNPYAMKEWSQEIRLPIPKATNDTKISIKNNNGEFIEI